jgi:hypothetical protein
MSALEVWRVTYREGREEKSKSFEVFDISGLKSFVGQHDVISVLFNVTGLDERTTHRHTLKDIYEEEVSIEDVPLLSMQWVEERRKTY